MTNLTAQLQAAEAGSRSEIVRLIHKAMSESYLTTGNQREKIAQDIADAILALLKTREGSDD